MKQRYVKDCQQLVHIAARTVLTLDAGNLTQGRSRGLTGYHSVWGRACNVKYCGGR